MRKTFLTILVISFAVSTWAATINPTAGGQVSSLVTNTNETSLTINGVIDARDFAYIGEKLTKLTTLNLEGATIAEYTCEKPIFGNQYVYPADIVPPMSLASHPALQTITFPTSATIIGTGALAGCENLTTVNLSQNLTNIEAFAFASCKKLTTITLPPAVTRLGEGAFTRCIALTSVKLGTTGTATSIAIGNEAFLGCSALTSFTFNSRMTTIGHRAFAGTKIKALDLSNYSYLQTIGDYAFAKAPLTTVKYPTNVTAIGTGVLLYSSATSVTLPNSLQNIPPFAFAGASGLEDINLAQTKIDSIGDYAFYKVNKPTSITLPSNTAHIGTKAMVGMTGLTKITSKASTVPTLDDDVWMGLNQPNIILYVPSQSIDSYSAADQWKEFNIQSGTLAGDVNCDGMVDVSDVNAVINYILKLYPGDPFVFDAGDLDDNGIIDVEDVNMMINIILKLVTYAPMAPNTSDAIVIDDFSIEVNEQRTVEVRLESSAQYAAMQCDIVLPDGLTITDVLPTESTIDHTIVMGDINGGVRILCFNNQGKAISMDSDSEPVVKIRVKANDNLATLSTIAIENTVLATPDCKTIICPGTTAWVSTTTGVNDINNYNAKVWAQGNVLYIEASNPTTAQLVAINGTATTLAVMGGLNEYADINPGIYIVRIGTESYKVAIR